MSLCLLYTSDDLYNDVWAWGRKIDEFGTLRHLQLLEDLSLIHISAATSLNLSKASTTYRTYPLRKLPQCSLPILSCICVPPASAVTTPVSYTPLLQLAEAASFDLAMIEEAARYNALENDCGLS